MDRLSALPKRRGNRQRWGLGLDSQRCNQNRCPGFLLRSLLLAGLTLAVPGCASTQSTSGQQAIDQVNDPLEPVNRGIFAFNNAVDTAFIRPVSLAYRDYVPTVFQDRVRDFLNNLRTPIIFANNLLQGDLEGAGTAAGRFFINSTIGIGGLIDIANYNNQGYPYRDADFGQTLAIWGAGDGPYLVLPLLGPSNLRDTAGLAVDSVADPVRIAVSIGDLDEFTYSRTGSRVIDARSRTIDATDELERSSIDYYATIRSVYQSSRANFIAKGKPQEAPAIPEIPDYGNSGVPVPVSAAPSAAPAAAAAAAGGEAIGMLPLSLDLNPMKEQ